MSGRTSQITIYVTTERKTELEQLADDQDDSVSGVINDMVGRQLQEEAQEAISSETRAEERIQELLSLGVEEMEKTAAEIRDMNAKFGTYAIANFEMLKQSHTDHVRKTALSTGARRIRKDLDTVSGTLADDPTTATQDASADQDDGPAMSPDSEIAGADHGVQSDEKAGVPSGEETGVQSDEEVRVQNGEEAGVQNKEEAGGGDPDADPEETDLFDYIRSDYE